MPLSEAAKPRISQPASLPRRMAAVRRVGVSMSSLTWLSSMLAVSLADCQMPAAPLDRAGEVGERRVAQAQLAGGDLDQEIRHAGASPPADPPAALQHRPQVEAADVHAPAPTCAV